MNILSWLCLLCLYFNLKCITCFQDATEITIRQGKLKGSINIFGNYKQYFGIPYASVSERFQEPGVPPSWNGTLTANRDLILCKQYSKELKVPIGQEDCLVLNIYTPVQILDNQLPVVVFLHGGGFYEGSKTDMIYNPKYLIRKNVIVVTVNYRLGAFGFLCLNKKEATGNMGFKDQIAALKWVKDNINQFGGNPDSVTLFGESAGASAVNYLLFTNVAKGLFHRAIIQSGTLLSREAFDENPIEAASTVAFRMGYNTTDPGELLGIFKNADAGDITKASNRDTTNNALGLYAFKPCLENSNTSENAVITKHPNDLLKSLKVDFEINIIIGYNNKEGIMWASYYNHAGLQNITQSVTDTVPHNFQFKDEESRSSFIKDVMKFYFKNSSTSGNTYDDLINYLSDSLIMYPTIVTMEAFLRNGNKMYNYYFEYDSFRNLNKLLLSKLQFTPGANHADELFYLFDPVVLRLLPVNHDDMTTINRLTTLWTNFAKTGVPSSCSAIPWNRSEKSLLFLQMNKQFEMITLPNKQRINFWKQAHEKYSSM